MAKEIKFELGNGNSATVIPNAVNKNINFWNDEYTPCVNGGNVIGFSLSEKSIDMMGKSLEKK